VAYTTSAESRVAQRRELERIMNRIGSFSQRCEGITKRWHRLLVSYSGVRRRCVSLLGEGVKMLISGNISRAHCIAWIMHV
jgi:hypothetical protein